ncbi:hypothetical protein AA313_de0205202 [Arthrobotrys entomopaga]|nr:hypothetical protein AA313_de0205202 [Arthrobotrys entomopaga]
MGGIIAADTLLSIVDDKPIKKSAPTSPVASPGSGSRRAGSLDPRKNKEASSSSSSSYFDDPKGEDCPLLFPAIVGICAFDTPYLGLSPSMFANSAENNFRVASDAFTTVSGIAKSLGFFQEAASAPSVATSSSGGQAAALPAAAGASTGGWGWGKLAMVAAAATTVSAGAGAAVYWNRSNITQGFNWVTSHLEFVGILFKPDDLKARVMKVSSVPGVGIANFYTILGKGAKSASTPGGKTLEVGGGGIRTFCSLPPKPTVSSPSTTTTTSPPRRSSSFSSPGGPSTAASSSDNRGTADIDVGSRDLRNWWYTQLNDKAADEVSAHTYMFNQATNPGYKEMLDNVSRRVMRWTINWYDAKV